MPLKEYIAETMTILKEFPEATEIVVEHAKRFRFAERGDYEALYKTVNDRLIAMQR
jgi:uncharacterized oxidoreductase